VALIRTIEEYYVRFEVSTAVNMMIIIFWEMTPCGSYKNRRFGWSYRLHLQGARVRAGYRAKVLIRATRCHLPDDNHLLHYSLEILNHAEADTVRGCETPYYVPAHFGTHRNSSTFLNAPKAKGLTWFYEIHGEIKMMHSVL
jgi:hypothetical protein